MPYLYLSKDGSVKQSQERPDPDDEIAMVRGDLRCFTLVGAVFTEIKAIPSKASEFNALKWQDVPQHGKVEYGDAERQMLVIKGWDQVMTEEEGCETWRFPPEKRYMYPEHVMSRTQHYWDLNEAVQTQRQMDKYQ